MKCSKNPIDKSIIHEMQEKLSRLQIPRGFGVLPVLIHASGVQESVEEAGLFHKTVDVREWLN